MAGARAQHPLGNRETPRIAAGISPIGGASGQRLRRYFFGASPPGEGGAGNNAKKPGATEGAGNNAGTAMPEMPDNAARHANRQVASTCRTGGGQRASHSRKQAAGDGQQAAGGGRAAIRRAAIRRAGGSIAHREDFMYIQTARNGRRCTHRHGGSPRHRESEIASEPCRLGSGKNHAGKQVLSTEIPEILRIREIQRMFTNYHKKRAEKSCILKIYV